VLATVGLVWLAPAGHAATTMCGQYQNVAVSGGQYVVQTNEWNSSATQCISTSGNADFTVTQSAINNATNGAPGSYPSIYKGCHWGNCTQNSGLPVQVSSMSSVTSDWSTTQPQSGAYDVAYDIWYNSTPSTSGQPDGAELMVWLNSRGGVQPAGSIIASNVSIGGAVYNIWYDRMSWNYIAYQMVSGTTSVTGLDIHAITRDAVSRGYVQPSWYLIDVEAGFELWQGGANLATNSFGVTVGTTPPTTPTTTTTTPTTTTTTPTTTTTTTSSSPFTISLQAISPNPTTPGTATNVTIDFKNTGQSTASNVTLVIEVVNSSGTVVGTQSWTGQNLAPQQTLNETYTWTASSTLGNYTARGRVTNASGSTLQQANVGTVTVH
jgi:hypothetical protein